MTTVTLGGHSATHVDHLLCARYWMDIQRQMKLSRAISRQHSRREMGTPRGSCHSWQGTDEKGFPRRATE